MWRIIIIQILLITVPSWAFRQCQPSRTIKLSPVDYTKLPVITSNLVRSKLTSNLFNYDWADISPEIERLYDIYQPAVKLSASVPDYLPPASLLDALEVVAHNRTHPISYQIHQYARGQGHLRLVHIVSKFTSSLMGRPIDPYKEILVTIGASNALDIVARTFLNPGEEVILFDPFYIMLKTAILNARGIPVYVPFIPKNGTTGKNSNDLTFDMNELESKISNRTKMIMLNNPNNPNGKSFTKEELTFIGHLAEKYNLVIVSDEAGLWYQYDKPASLPGLFKRTVTIISGGKMFSNAGWKIGWVIAPEDKLWGMHAISSQSLLSIPTPLQIAFAMSLETEFQKINSSESYWKHINEKSLKTRNKLIAILRSVGAEYIVPSAGYSIVANFTRLADQIDLSSETDCRPGMRFYTFLLKKGIAVNPTSIYYSPKNMWRTEYVIRLTNMKTDKTIDDFARTLTSIFRPVQIVSESK